MTKEKVLVTGATGSTGRETVRLLRAREVPVRALVHREDARAGSLRALGAEVVVGDLLDLDSVRAALDGVQRAYFVYPIRPGLLPATAYFAQAAREVKLEAVVNMSQISARREARSHAARDHFIGERVFDWSGVPTTHLRPTLFAEWALYWAAQVPSGTMRLPFGTGHHAPIAAADQARLIAEILVAPAAHAGKTYPLYGTEEVTFAEMTRAIGDEIGKPLVYQQTDVPTFRQLVEASGRVLPDFFWQHVTEIARDHQEGVFSGTDEVIARVTGEAPVGLKAFLHARRSVFLEGKAAR